LNETAAVPGKLYEPNELTPSIQTDTVAKFGLNFRNYFGYTESARDPRPTRLDL